MTGPVTRAGEVAVFSLSPEPGSVEVNLALAARTLRREKATRSALRWAVLPELFTSGYTNLGSAAHYAEDAVSGPSAAFFTALSAELDVYIAYGFPERVDTEVVANSANLVGPEGVLLTYRKRRLVHQAREPEVFVVGEEMPVVEAGGVRVALSICWDLMFPETVREAAVSGAELVLAPSAWEDPYGPQYDLACAARSLDNALYVASANQTGAYPEAVFSAPGGVYRYDGEQMGKAALVDLSAMQSYRETFGGMLGELEGMPIPGEVRP